MPEDHKQKIVIIGGGPAGLTAAYELCKAGMKSIVLEKDDIVGGISRTANYKGYLFDIGGHRFFTKVKTVEDMWHEVLPDGDFLRRGRLSRIYYNKRFFYYPLRPSNALLGLGIWNSFMIVMSYIKAQLFPEKTELTFKQWISNRFGKRLYNTFFKTYTEKVWGMPCNEISADWAAQRIKGLSLIAALKNALIKSQVKDKKNVIKTLIDQFDYPKRGPGMMWERVTDIVRQKGSEVRLNANVDRILWRNRGVYAVEVNSNGRKELIEGCNFISSMPIRELIQKMDPAVPTEVLEAALALGYRDFLTVALIVNKRELFQDNWIYIHDPNVQVGRIQNFKNWSPYMVPDPEKTCLGLEYFCFEGDGLWTMTDKELVELGKKEIDMLGLAQSKDVEDGTVLRIQKAYPVYDATYLESLRIIRQFLGGLENLQLVGRNGMHKYNNQDHSMLTAMLAVKNIMGGQFDLWQVNAEQEYHEEVSSRETEKIGGLAEIAATQPRVPMPSGTSRFGKEVSGLSDTVIIRSFARMDKLAFASATGIISGIGLFLATLFLVIKRGDVTGPNLALISQYFVGYSVSFPGAFVGMAYASFWGFIYGWLFAYLRNFSIALFIYSVKKKSEILSYRDLLDHF